MRHGRRRNQAKPKDPIGSMQARLADHYGVSVNDVRYTETHEPREDGSKEIASAWEIRKDGKWRKLPWTEIMF